VLTLCVAGACLTHPCWAQAPTFLGKWGLVAAHGIATDAAGNVFVVKDNDWQIYKFDNNGTYLAQWPTAPYPYTVAIGTNGNVYVTGNESLRRYDANGVFLNAWPTIGSGPGAIEVPWGVATDAAGNVYVMDAANERVQEYDGSLNYLTEWGSGGSGNGQFNESGGVATDAAGNVYVADTYNNRVQKFTSGGSYLTQWGTSGSGNGQFSAPFGIAVDAAGNVYVADTGNDRIEKFTGSGTYLTQWGSGGSGNGQFNWPYYIALDAMGDIFVTDYYNNRVQKFRFSSSILSITDVRNDQGREVRLRFRGDGLDFVGSPLPITRYDIFRRIDPLADATAGATAGGTRGLVHPAPASGPDGALLAGWDYVLSVPANADSEYDVVVPTLADSNGTGLHETVLLVRASTATIGKYFDAVPDSGYSVDNMPPAPPSPFTAAYTGGATHLHWGANSDPDFCYYRLYRGNSAAFVPDPSNLIATSSDTGYTDPGAAGSYYKLSAVDVNGNESPFTPLSPAQTLDAGIGGPLALALEAPWPNPVRGGAVNVTFVLPRSAPAMLELLDVAGRRIGGREVGSLGAGRHAISLGNGRALTPGLYLIRLTQGASRTDVRVTVLE
jgi:NHL repeat-containing protein